MGNGELIFGNFLDNRKILNETRVVRLE